MAYRTKRSSTDLIERQILIGSYIGKKMRERRKLMQKSQSWLGEQLGMTFQQIQKYERGTNRVSAQDLFLISEFLEVPVEWFFEGLPKKPSSKETTLKVENTKKRLKREAIRALEEAKRAIESIVEE